MKVGFGLTSYAGRMGWVRDERRKDKERGLRWVDGVDRWKGGRVEGWKGRCVHWLWVETRVKKGREEREINFDTRALK